MLAPAIGDDAAELLDRPIWTALTTRHRRFALRLESARRFPETISPFAATRDDTPDSLDALTRLVHRGKDRAILMQAGDIAVPRSLHATSTALGVQMLADRPVARPAIGDVVRLTQRDVSDMVALAQRTKPGPFGSRTPLLGAFWGLRRDGNLVAMAGERLKQPGFTEVSGVCVHPEHRGCGHAARLTGIVAAHIQARGETPYLHAFADNEAAIRLYRKLGFRLRREVSIAALERQAETGCGAGPA